MPSIWNLFQRAPKGDNFRRPEGYTESYIDRSFQEAAEAASSNLIVDLKNFFQSTNKKTWYESKNENAGSVPKG
jgi:hypothetical protein